MRNLEIEHEGTLNAVKAKLRRVKKGSPYYFISHRWEIHTDNENFIGTNLESMSKTLFKGDYCILTKERVR
tara:strand:+ start:1068 stop:1280 length:213 start_codon:yes stop_codon:yes gene_type:complete